MPIYLYQKLLDKKQEGVLGYLDDDQSEESNDENVDQLDQNKNNNAKIVNQDLDRLNDLQLPIPMELPSKVKVVPNNQIQQEQQL